MMAYKDLFLRLLIYVDSTNAFSYINSLIFSLVLYRVLFLWKVQVL